MHPTSRLVIATGSLLLLSGLAGSTSQAASAESTAGALPRVVIVVGQEAPPRVRFAADELQGMLHRLFTAEVVVRTAPAETQAAVVLLGQPGTNPFLADAVGKTWPKLSPEGLVLRRLEAKEPTLVVAGGSPRATLWAVYELGERLGVRYLHYRDAYPPKRPWQGLPGLNVVMEPNMRIRCWRLVNDLAHGPVSWTLEENRRFLRQIAKMKYNRIHVSLWPTQPFVHYTFGGIPKPPGVLFFGHRHRIDEEIVGRERFAGMKVFTNPELLGADSPEELRSRAIGLVRGILAEARRLGMQTGLSIQPFEWPKEFIKVLPGSEPARQLSGLTAGPGSDQAMNDPRLREVVATITRAYVETYPQIDYLHVGMPEHRGWVGRAEEAYRQLGRRYNLEGLGSFEELCARARGRTTFPGGGARVEAMLRGDLASIWFFDSLLHEKRLLARPGGGDIKIVYNGVVAELFPLLARMVPPGGEVLSFIDYTASRQLRQRDLLRQTPPPNVAASLIFTLADDNVGVLPQLATGSLHTLLGELRNNRWAGFYTRYWTVGDLDPCIHYLARASWDSSITPQEAYADQVSRVCGPEAVEPALEALGIIEQITVGLDDHGLGFAFPVPGMMTKHYASGGLSPEVEQDHKLYEKARALMRLARRRSRPAGHDYLDYFVGRLRFAIRYLDAAEQFGATARSEKANRPADALGHAESAARAIRDALQAYVEVARDHGDLGAVALMNEYCCRPIREKRDQLRKKQTPAEK